MSTADPLALAVAAAIEFRPQVDWGAPMEIENDDGTYMILDAPDRPDWLVAEVARGPKGRVVVDLFEHPSAIRRPDGVGVHHSAVSCRARQSDCHIINNEPVLHRQYPGISPHEI